MRGLTLKQSFLIWLLTCLLAATSSVSAQSPSTVKSGSFSIDGPNEAEFGYFRLDGERWVVAVQTRESTRTKDTKRKIPSALLITCSKDRIRYQGTTFFEVDAISQDSKLPYRDVIVITFCKNMQRFFGVRIPDSFLFKSN